MQNIKSHKTIEQIAKKHGVDISFIEKQLEIGEPIEHEHTKDHDLAKDIALQHLGEIPDYYTRLKRMEKSAKKGIKENVNINDKYIKELEIGLKKLNNISYKSIDKLMRNIMKKYNITAKQLHYAFKNKHNKTPDDWIKELKEETEESSLADVDSPVHIPPVKGTHIDHEKRYCPKCEKEELRSECKYGPKYWELFSIPSSLSKMVKTEEKDHEYSMARSQLSTIDSAVKRLKRKMKGEGNIEAWVQSKLTKASDYLDAVADYIDSGEHDVEEGASFEIGPNHRQAQRKNKLLNLTRNNNNPEEVKSESSKLSIKWNKPKLKEQKLVDKILDEIIEEKNKGLWHNIHNRRKKGLPPKKPGQEGYPKTLNIEETELEEGIKQARKNVGASKCWKGKKLGNPKTKIKNGREVPNCVPEDVTIEDAEGNTFAEVIDLITPEPIKGFKSQVTEASRMQAQTGNVVSVTLTWRGKYYSLKIFFPQVKLPSRKDINNELQKVYPGSKVVYHSVSEIQPGQPLIQAFGPQGGSSAKLGSNRNYVKPMGEEFEVEEDWQKINRQDKKDGLSQKAVDAYRRENPGSKLQTAVTEKNPTGNRKDRKNAFCRRMSGMKKRLTSAKTARDPNSRINKALNRWNCN